MSIKKIAEAALQSVSNEINQKDAPELPKATPTGIAAAKDSMETPTKMLDQLADDAKGMYDDSKELFKQALKTLTEAEERKKQATDKLD
jgi:hypothetical protein